MLKHADILKYKCIINAAMRSLVYETTYWAPIQYKDDILPV